MISKDVNSNELSAIANNNHKQPASGPDLYHLNHQIKQELHQTLAKREALRILKKGKLIDIKSILRKYQVS